MGSAPSRRLIDILGWVTLAFIVAGLYGAFIYTPPERTMGDFQRIFYFHMPLAVVALLAFSVTFVASIGYLVRGRRRWDVYAFASAEVGLIFCTLGLVTGSLWAKPMWGAYWTWDPRLTTTAILWLIYVAYLILRSAIEEPSRRGRFAAVFAIVGFIDVPIVFMSIRWWRTIHPVVITAQSIDLAPSMLQALIVGMIAILLLFLYLLLQRVRLGLLRDEVEVLRQNLVE